MMASANSLEDAAEHLQRNRAVVFEAETACFNLCNCTDFLINSLGCPVVGIERLLVFHRNFNFLVLCYRAISLKPGTLSSSLLT